MKRALKYQFNPKTMFIASSMRQILKNKNERMKNGLFCDFSYLITNIVNRFYDRIIANFLVQY